MPLCATCTKAIDEDGGVQCQGPCGLWRHYGCIANATEEDIADMKSGKIDVKCPCPNCEKKTSGPAGTKEKDKGFPFGTPDEFKEELANLHKDSQYLLAKYKEIEHCMDTIAEFMKFLGCFAKKLSEMDEKVGEFTKSQDIVVRRTSKGKENKPVEGRPCYCPKTK